MGFGKKLYLGSFGTIIMTILIIAGVNFFQSKTSFLAKGKAGIQSVSDVLLQTIQVQYNLQQGKIDADLGMLLSETEAAGNIMLVASRTLDLEVRDAGTGATSALTLPKLIFGLEFVTGQYNVVDKVGRYSDSEIAIFQVFEDKLIKVSTSFKNADESRPIGEYFPSGSDLLQSVNAGDRSVFLANSGLDKVVQTVVPFRDLDEVVAGAYSVSSKILTSDLIGLVEKVTVNGHGYSFVMDESGKILVHPDKAYVNRDVRDFTGGETLVETDSGFVSYAYDGQTYYAYVNRFAPWGLSFVVAVSEAELMAGVNRQIFTSSGISGVIALVLGALIIGLMNRQLMTHMKGMATLAKEVAEGNFQHTFTYKAQDAIQDTVLAMNGMVSGLADMIRDLNKEVDTLTDASDSLNKISDEMGEGAETSVNRVNTVASAAEEMSVNMDSVAAAMEQATTNVETVSANTGEMRTSIEKVSQNSNQTRDITQRAVEQARLTSDRVRKLGQAAEEIDKVTDTITNISSQTNLLALNATIEAARAGEAGKGFAVVANEIKDLAGQTASATEDIAANIREIQQQIQGAVGEIQDITATINEINSFVEESAEAIELQSGTTQGIAENISQVSTGIQEVNENVAHSSQVSGQVANDIADVLTAAENIRTLSANVKEKAAVLDRVTAGLRTMTERFKL